MKITILALCLFVGACEASDIPPDQFSALVVEGTPEQCCECIYQRCIAGFESDRSLGIVSAAFHEYTVDSCVDRGIGEMDFFTRDGCVDRQCRAWPCNKLPEQLEVKEVRNTGRPTLRDEQ